MLLIELCPGKIAILQINTSGAKTDIWDGRLHHLFLLDMTFCCQINCCLFIIFIHCAWRGLCNESQKEPYACKVKRQWESWIAIAHLLAKISLQLWPRPASAVCSSALIWRQASPVSGLNLLGSLRHMSTREMDICLQTQRSYPQKKAFTFAAETALGQSSSDWENTGDLPFN